MVPRWWRIRETRLAKVRSLVSKDEAQEWFFEMLGQNRKLPKFLSDSRYLPSTIKGLVRSMVRKAKNRTDAGWFVEEILRTKEEQAKAWTEINEARAAKSLKSYIYENWASDNFVVDFLRDHFSLISWTPDPVCDLYGKPIPARSWFFPDETELVQESTQLLEIYKTEFSLEAEPFPPPLEYRPTIQPNAPAL